MFYTIYPIPRVTKKRTARRVEPVSRIKASKQIRGGHILLKDITTPNQQVYGPQEVKRIQKLGRDKGDELNSFQMALDQNIWDIQMGESMLPLLLVWRRPKAVIASDFIERRHDRLRAARAHRRMNIKQQHIAVSKERGISMTVIKKSGKKEEFMINKLSDSINSANAKTDETLEMSTLTAEFRQIVSGKRLITTQQIDVIVYGLLYSKGLLKTLINYISYDKK